jgi:hypothetical protein
MNDLATRLRRLADTRRRGHSVHPDVLREAANAIDNLTAERDEARREILLWVKERCSWAELTEEIKKRGWEYLKEVGK